jgi:MoaA/NifB/PqqE/SkfB family radical SAM enzyme
MKINAKRIRLALRSPGNLRWAVRHVIRNSPLGGLDRHFLKGYSFRPNLITVNITARCNLRCDMCMQPRDGEGENDSTTVRGRQAELTVEDWCRVVDEAAPTRPAFYFTGGEPLLYKGLTTILGRVKQHGMIAALVTNGTALSRHAEELVRIGVDNVTVSLDGPERIHDTIRGVPGTFQRAAEGIRALREARTSAGAQYPAIKANCVITAQSIPTLEETLAVARDIGIEELNFQHPMFDTAENVALHNRVFPETMEGAPASPQAAGEDSKREGEFYEGRLTEREFDQLETALRRILSDRSILPRVQFFPPVAPNDWHDYYLDLGYPFKNLCTMPWTTMRLLADGSFEPCLHYVVGSVRDTPLWNLWNKPRARHFRRVLAKQGLFPACARCCYRCY